MYLVALDDYGSHLTSFTSEVMMSETGKAGVAAVSVTSGVVSSFQMSDYIDVLSLMMDMITFILQFKDWFSMAT